MTMTLEKSFKWLDELEADYMADLRLKLAGNVDEAVIETMAMLYRQGWHDCFRNARLHGVDRTSWQSPLQAASQSKDCTMGIITVKTDLERAERAASYRAKRKAGASGNGKQRA